MSIENWENTMCGIVGVVNINKSARTLREDAMQDLHAAMEVQRHRGPDDQGVCSFCFEDKRSYSVAGAHDLNPEWLMDGIMGFNCFSIKDLSMAGHQPILDNKFIDFVMQLSEDMLLRFRAPSPITLSDNPIDWAAGKYLFKGAMRPEVWLRLRV